MTCAAPVTIRCADWHDPADHARLSAIRRAVFIIEQQVPEALEWDDDDAAATHLLAIDPASGEAVGTARILPDGRIGRMAVLPSWRGRRCTWAGLSSIHWRLRTIRPPTRRCVDWSHVPAIGLCGSVTAQALVSTMSWWGMPASSNISPRSAKPSAW